MLKEWRLEQIRIFPQFFKWSAIAVLIALMSGSASAFFLLSLDWVTNWREGHSWIIACLPLGGFVVGLLYHYFGKSVEAGNNLILEEIHEPKATIPLRMTPLILLGTLATHFFGGSAGREGTAVQMGGSLADQLTGLFKLNAKERRVLLMTGMSAGFASVFGTPIAGAVFGLEVLSIGKLSYEAIFPCFIAAVLGGKITLAWGIRHDQYAIGALPGISFASVISCLAAGVVCGLTGWLFAALSHFLSAVFKEKIRYGPFRPLIGGMLVAGAVGAVATTKYIGLGTQTILASFRGPLPAWDFIAKIAFTALTLGAGLKGGEVTPLFFIGATLGNALSPLLALPLPLLSAIGFVAVFAGAANTPISATVLAMELFHSDIGVYAGLACVTSYLFSGHAGIYLSQRREMAKNLSR